MKFSVNVFVCIALLSLGMGCIRNSRTARERNDSVIRATSTPGGVERISFETGCEISTKANRLNERDVKLSIDASMKLVNLFRKREISNEKAREAVAAGIPLVESVFGDNMVPVIGPGFKDKPRTGFVWLTVIPEDTKSTCRVGKSGEIIEFIPIILTWTVRGVGRELEKWRDDGQQSFNFGVRLGSRRESLFYFGDDWASN